MFSLSNIAFVPVSIGKFDLKRSFQFSDPGTLVFIARLFKEPNNQYEAHSCPLSGFLLFFKVCEK